MKKRSKLDLTPDLGKEKSQASGFSSEIPPGPENAAAPKPETKTNRSSQRSGADTRRSHHDTPATATMTRAPARAMLAISVAVAAIAAVSLFMLKRR